MLSKVLVLTVMAAAVLCPAQKDTYAPYPSPQIPRLKVPPRIDGDASEWKYHAFHDGAWDVLRARQTPWYNPRVNRLTDHSNEPALADDLTARYYLAWDDRYLYLGAEVRGNVNDVEDPAHTADRWYYGDAICWFHRGAPAESVSEIRKGRQRFLLCDRSAQTSLRRMVAARQS
jgi:hypothetical protein